MKSRIMKVLGVVVALATLTSLLASTAIPANAAVGSNTWGIVDTPSAVGNVLTAATDVNLLAASPDGKALFAWDNNAKLLYKSTTNGATWGAGVAIATVLGVVVNGIKVSPNYATDSALVIVEPTKVWLSTNGGASFVDVANSDLAIKIGAAVITSVDIGNYYANNTLTVLIGVAGALGTATSKVLAYTSGGFAWASIGAQLTDVFGVEFSSNHMTDAEIIAVIYGAGNLTISSRFGALAWGIAAYPDLNIVASAAAPTSAIIALASDYVANSGAPILVGTIGATTNNVYRITGRAGVAGTAVATGLAAGIQSIAISGPMATSTVYAGTIASGIVYRSTSITGATPTWLPASKSPTGITPNVAVAGTAVFAGTTGADSAVSVSNDAGVSFNQVGLIDVGPLLAAALQVNLVSLTVVDANTMFLVMGNTAGGGYNTRYIFKTTDGGVAWQRIYSNALIAMISASTAYATDSAIVVSDGTTTLQKSVNGGATFAPVGTVAAAVTAIFCLDTNNIYVGAATALYKLGRFSAATGIASGNVVSIAPNPKDTTKATFAVGTSTGWVYQSTNDVVSFTAVGAAALGAANSIVQYGTDGTLYAANGVATVGAARWTGAAWLTIQATGAGGATGLGVVADNTLYVSDATAGAAAFRSLKPLGATAAACEFQPMSSAIFAAFPAAGVAVDLDVIKGTADNTILVVDTATAEGTYLYKGRVYGFKDILILTPTAGRTPANAALLTTVTSATIGWTAVTGATGYAYVLDGAAEVATAPAGTAGAALAAFTGGTTHTWSYRVSTPLFSRQSANFTFITALEAVVPAASPTLPPLGAVNVTIDTTFTWPTSAGATGYEFVIAEDLGETNKFAIIDYSATTPTNAHKLRENLKYNTTYWWQVRPFNATTKGAFAVFFFTTVKAPVETTAVATTPPVVITSVPPPQITLTIPATTTQTVEVIPQFLLWAVIGVGAVLVIAVIILIVRTRRIS